MKVSGNLESRVIASCVARAYGPGMMLIDYLAGRFTYLSRSEWLRRIDTGQLSVNDSRPSPNQVLAAGDVVRYRPPDLAEPPVDLLWEIIYEDENLLIVNKSGNLPVHPAGPFYRHTLWFELRRIFDAVYFANRLDRETSGLVLVAKDAVTARRLSQTACRKEYMALVLGAFDKPVDAEGVLVPDHDSVVRKKQRFVFAADNADRNRGKRVATRLEPVAVYPDISLIRALPETGRLHQIRATLYSLGFPLLGDKLYGADELIYLKIRNDSITADDRERLRMPRQALHSASVTFLHPFTGRPIHAEVPLPGDFQDVLNQY